MSLIESIQNANEKFNISYSKNGYKSKVLTLDDIPTAVDLYKLVYETLQKQGCEKFIHPLNKEAIEEIICSKEQAIVGYFKNKQLLGALYTKPFAKTSPYFKTPSFDGDKTSYTLGGLAVSPEFRGQGVITKLSGIIHSGVKNFATTTPSADISGIGAEISCENFSSLAAAQKLTDENGNNMLNFVGLHYNPNEKDIDLTVLGYSSFSTPTTSLESLPNATLNGNQQQSFDELKGLTSKLGEQTSGTTTTNVDDHIITTLNTYVSAPYSQVLALDKGDMEQ